MTALPPPRRAWRFHLVAGILTLLACAVLFALYRLETASAPARGYTSFGLVLALGGSACLVGVALYALRKRGGQEWLPGRLQTWLGVHVWLSLLGTWAILLHAGFHLDDTGGALTLLLLAATVGSGLIGWWLYRALPGHVAAPEVGNLAADWTRARIAAAQEELEGLAAGASKALGGRIRGGKRARGAVGVLAADEEALAARARTLREELAGLEARLARQVRLQRLLRGWLWVHVPAALLLLAAIPLHVLDALDVRHDLRAPRPGDFASPESCLPCHQVQYDEWIHSMHAMAMSAPTVDIQNRLVMAKEARDLARQPRAEPLVGDLCVRCHAPTGSHPMLDGAEGPLTDLAERTPASHFGVSCVACHQISALHPMDPATDPFAAHGGGEPIRFRNADNFTWRPGRVMRGHFGQTGELPSVGNASHQGRYDPLFESAELCASCHTVTVDDPVADQQLKLQDTFREWEDGGDARGTGINWKAAGVRCLHCHARDLDDLAAAVAHMAREDLPLAERRARIGVLMGRHVVERPVGGPAAAPRDGFDRPLPDRRRFRHDFTGVDVPLDADAPFPPGHARHGENPAIRERMLERTTKLLRTAAAVRIEGVEGGDLVVEVLNLATGHHLPAGFAFARELWLEVGTRRGTADPFRVHLGGRDGRPLGDTERLAKAQEGPRGLRNFQAVLWNGKRGDQPGQDGLPAGETVLQNETVKVLTGQAARDQGFLDREGFLLPGEIRALRVPLSSLPGFRRGDEVRVRLRFRNFPPEFLDALAARAARELPDADHARAARLKQGLRIIDVATDTWR